MSEPRDRLHRIRVAGRARATDPLRCRLGWHRILFYRNFDYRWFPRCSRCGREARWHADERKTAITSKPLRD